MGGQLLSFTGSADPKVAFTFLVHERIGSAVPAALAFASSFMPNFMGSSASDLADCLSRRAAFVGFGHHRALLEGVTEIVRRKAAEMPDRRVRWDGVLESWSFRAGVFYTTADIKDEGIHPKSVVMASASEADEAGERILGDTVVMVGAIVPYDGGAHVQICTSTNSLNPSRLKLVIMLTITDLL